MKIPLLTSGESKVFHALVKLGETSIGNIIKISGVSHSKVYDILKRLSEKGLVSSINKNGRQFFSASDPSQLLDLIKEKEEELQENKNEISELVIQLQSQKNVSKPTSILSSYEGFGGMKTVLDLTLNTMKKNDEILILGSPKKIGEQAGGYLKEWQKRRIKVGAKCKIITDLDSPSWNEKWWQTSKKRKITFTKRSSSISPAYFVITETQVVTIYFSSIILSFVIEHPEIAENYGRFFNILWKT